MNSPISIVVRTFNSARVLPDVLSKLQLTNGDEIIIVDSGSQDTTLAIAKSFNCRIFHLPPPFNYSKALNLGFGAAKNSWVLSLSSHCIPVSPHYLDEWRNAIDAFSDDVAAAFGPALLTIKTLSKIDHKDLHQFRGINEWKPYQQFLAGNSNGLYRKRRWMEYPFNEMLSRAEDWDWLIYAEQKKYLTVLVSGAAVLYRNQGTLRYMFVKGLKDARIARKMINADKITFRSLCIGISSLAKKLFLGQISFKTFLRQNAHNIGYFWGSHQAKESEN